MVVVWTPRDYEEKGYWIMSETWEKGACQQCNRRSMFYCPRCAIVVNPPEGVIVPQFRLPFKLFVALDDNIKKSSSIHAKVLAPADTEICQFPDEIPNFDPATTVVLFPSEGAKILSEFEHLEAIRNVVVIDSTWQKTGRVLLHPHLQSLPHVKLANPPEESRFWRFHSLGSGCVSTIEAIQYFVNDFAEVAGRHGSGGVRGETAPSASAYHRGIALELETVSAPVIETDGLLPPNPPDVVSSVVPSERSVSTPVMGIEPDCSYTSGDGVGAAFGGMAGSHAAPEVFSSGVPDMLYFFDRQYSIITEKNTDSFGLPMDPAVKQQRREKQRQDPVRSAALKRKHHLERWIKLKAEGNEDIMKCFNCRRRGHRSKECVKPCRFCGERGHFNAHCPKRPCNAAEIAASTVVAAASSEGGGGGSQ